MRVEKGTSEHLEAWGELRASLWPERTPEQHRRAIAARFLDKGSQGAGFLCFEEEGTLMGFAEASVRKDNVDGQDASSVLFLESLYVHPDHRLFGVGRQLIHAVTDWGKAAGCAEFVSDVLMENVAGQNFYKTLGFSEARRVVFLRKKL